MRKYAIYSIILLLVFFIGCANKKIPTPNTISLGATKDAIRQYWGEPDKIIKLGTGQWGVEKEEWIYEGSFPKVPLDYKYLFRTKHLYFDGNNLTSFKTEEPKAGKQP